MEMGLGWIDREGGHKEREKEGMYNVHLSMIGEEPLTRA